MGRYGKSCRSWPILRSPSARSEWVVVLAIATLVHVRDHHHCILVTILIPDSKTSRFEIMLTINETCPCASPVQPASQPAASKFRKKIIPFFNFFRQRYYVNVKLYCSKIGKYNCFWSKDSSWTHKQLRFVRIFSKITSKMHIASNDHQKIDPNCARQVGWDF